MLKFLFNPSITFFHTYFLKLLSEKCLRLHCSIKNLTTNPSYAGIHEALFPLLELEMSEDIFQVVPS